MHLCALEDIKTHQESISLSSIFFFFWQESTVSCKGSWTGKAINEDITFGTGVYRYHLFTYSSSAPPLSEAQNVWWGKRTRMESTYTRQHKHETPADTHQCSKWRSNKGDSVLAVEDSTNMRQRRCSDRWVCRLSKDLRLFRLSVGLYKSAYVTHSFDI